MARPRPTARRVLAAGALALVWVSVGSLSPRASSSGIVISEFRTRGPSGGNDEFVELYNASAAPVDISGWKIWGSNASGTVSARATIPANVFLEPGCHYLATNSGTSGYSGGISGNATYSTGITDDGGIAITRPDNTIVDQVGLSSGSAYKEGYRSQASAPAT